jgi:anti-anti-sigma factor
MSHDHDVVGGERRRSVEPIVPGGKDVTAFDVRATENDGVATVTVTGDLDCATAPRLRATLERLAATGQTVLVDLSGTEFMDCAGVGVLMGTHARLHDLGGELVVGSPNRPVLRVLELTGVLDVVSLSGSEG